MFVSTVNIQCSFVLFELFSHISAARYPNFLAFSSPNEGMSFTVLLPGVFVLRGVPFWPTYVTVTSAKLLSPWQREVWGRDAPTWKAGCCCLPTVARASISPHNLHFRFISDIQEGSEPRNLHFSISVSFFCMLAQAQTRQQEGKGG